ncbi:MAG: helix-turn-helix transcriptional regulator [Clostridia bacterium]|nr:helix-turn-helix transcriptional regulator [Clostridia bacterium]
MRRIQLHTIPEIWFGHTWSSPEYDTTIPAYENKLEICFFSEGTAIMETDGQSYTVEKNDVIVNCFQAPLTIRTTVPHAHHTVAFIVNYTVSEEEGTYAPFLTKFDSSNHKIARLIDQIIYQNTIALDSNLTCAGLLLELIGELHEVHRRREQHISHGEARYVQEAKRYILKHLHFPITQREVAAHLGITPEYLCALFKKVEKETVLGFINRIKLEGIRSLMEREGLKLYQAAEQYGYADPNYVSRLFKKVYRMNCSDLKRAK